MSSIQLRKGLDAIYKNGKTKVFVKHRFAIINTVRL